MPKIFKCLEIRIIEASVSHLSGCNGLAIIIISFSLADKCNLMLSDPVQTAVFRD